jgi:rhodanese-related sulfurtransferase
MEASRHQECTILAVRITSAGLACGLAWNTWSGRRIALGANALLREGAEEIDAAEARARFDRGALFLDARPVANYEMGHIPGRRRCPRTISTAISPSWSGACRRASTPSSIAPATVARRAKRWPSASRHAASTS